MKNDFFNDNIITEMFGSSYSPFFHQGKVAKDFYYKIKSGKKCNYTRKDNKRTAKDCIPKDVNFGDIQELSEYGDLSETQLETLLKEKEQLIVKCSNDIKNIQLEVHNRRINDDYNKFLNGKEEAKSSWNEDVKLMEWLNSL